MAAFRKRGKKWYYTIEIGDGTTRKRYSRVGGYTKAECEKAYRQALNEIEYGRNLQDLEKMTVNDFFRQFLEEHLPNVAKANTINTYNRLFKNHISPVIGSRKLKTVNARILQNLLYIKKKEGLASSTVNSICALLKSAFKWGAAIGGYFPVSPAINISVPKYIQPPKRTHVFTAEEMDAIFSAFPEEHQFHLPLILAYHTGMRLGECLALKWQDVDFDNLTISIHATLTDYGYQEEPKNNASVREIVFGQKLLKKLKKERIRQNENKLKYGSHYIASDFVCRWQSGQPLSSNDLRFFGQFCKKTFGSGSFHSLRHTHATMLLEAGEDLEIVSKRLGHSSINTTANIYSHILDKRKEQSRHLLDNIL